MGRGARMGAWVIGLGLTGVLAAAQTPVAKTPVVGAGEVRTAAPVSGDGVLVDQVIAVVNGDLILDSDVDEERRFQAFQPLRATGNFSREKAIDRLIDRDLILQQTKVQPADEVTDAEVAEQLLALRQAIPECKQYHCETEAGWTRYVQAQGFTLAQLTERWRQRMEILKFIELRFRMGIRVEPQEIKDYYDKTLLPDYARQKAKAPALAEVSDRIQEILLQERVTSLLEDWLKSLKAQGSVRLIKQGEVSF